MFARTFRDKLYNEMIQQMATITTSTYQSPKGTLVLGTLDDSLCLCDWECSKRHEAIMRRLRLCFGATVVEGTTEGLVEAAKQLDEYFAGQRTVFTSPTVFAGTDFQKTVWHQLTLIPFGSTVSYADIAIRVARPAAVRAVATAIALNALSVIVPCHRVVASDGSLSGYGGGAERKLRLLELECGHASNRQQPLFMYENNCQNVTFMR